MKNIAFCLALVCTYQTSLAQSNFSDRIRQAVQSEARTEAEVARDANRKPIETLTFFQITENMKVLELVPGGGWYTKLLAPALKDKGELYLAIGTGRVQEKLLDQPGYDHVKVLEGIDIYRPEGSRFYNLDPFTLAEKNFDAALTFRNQHNFSAEGRASFNKAVYEALKPGGLFGVVDHTRRHMEPPTSENRRRLDPVLVIKEVLDQGFELVDYSTLHYRPNDALSLEVGEDTVTGRTDRFTILFRKPK